MMDGKVSWPNPEILFLLLPTITTTTILMALPYLRGGRRFNGHFQDKPGFAGF